LQDLPNTKKKRQPLSHHAECNSHSAAITQSVTASKQARFIDRANDKL
jgi:hypothetical protein